MAHKFDPAKVETLESPERRASMPPERILRAVGLKRGMVFADVGAGTGFFSLPAAELVGPSGRVYALDIEETMLQLLRAKNPPAWLEIILGEESRLPLPGSVADLVFSSMTLHEAHEPVALLREMGRIARPRVPIVVFEWAKRRQREGPPYEERLHHHRTEALMLEAGLCFRKLEFYNPSLYFAWGFRK